MKIKMLVEVDCDLAGTEVEEKRWFMDNVLLNRTESGGLILHSNEIGDMLGPVTVIEVHPF